MLHQHLFSSIRPYSCEDTGSSVLQSEILIIKRSTIDGLPSAIVKIKDRTLTQRTWYDTSESRSLVADSFISCEVDRVIICSDGVQIEGEKSNESASTIMQQPRQEKERETHSAVFGTTSARRTISMRPAGLPPMAISKKQTGLALFSVEH